MLDAACAIPLCAISGALSGGVRVEYVAAADAFGDWARQFTTLINSSE